jgi:hypothetical protein
LAEILLDEIELPRAGKLVVLNHEKLARLPRTWIREVFRQTWLREGWPCAQMGYQQWDRLAGLVLGEQSALDLPGDVRARRRDRVVQVGPAS